MKTYFLRLATINIVFFLGCQTKVDKGKLEKLVELTRPFPKTNICIKEKTNFPESQTKAIKSILFDLEFDCCMSVFEVDSAVGQLNEDSILILTKRRSLEIQTIYYDFSKRKRILETWNYPNAADKRVKLEDRLYLQTSGFD